MLSGSVNVIWVVAVALIDADARVLVQRRPAGRPMAGLWEFPGGKIEPGETPEGALVRELREELGIAVAPEDMKPLTFASEPIASGHLVLLLYACRRWQGDPAPCHAEAVAWHDVDGLRRLAMPPADGPLIEVLARALSEAQEATSRSAPPG